MSVFGCEVVRGAAAPKEPMTYAVFFFEPQGWNWGLEARIWALKLGCWPQDWDLGSICVKA